MDRLYYETFASPIGTLCSVVSEQYLYYLQPVDYAKNSTYLQRLQRELGEIHRQTTPLSLKLQNQLNDYFKKQQKTFTIPLKPIGTDFQQQVWHALTMIDYGQTASYKEIAQLSGYPKAYQAVGSAIGKNPILILQPCHRILPMNGTLGGFSAGRERKIHLLKLESIIKGEIE